MPGERTVFLDFDDTLSDPFQFHVQYVREVGALLAPRYGGSEERWAKAAIDLGVPTYRFLRNYLERRPPVPVTLRQVDPLIRQLTLYRDLIEERTGDPS